MNEFKKGDYVWCVHDPASSSLANSNRYLVEDIDTDKILINGKWMRSGRFSLTPGSIFTVSWADDNKGLTEIAFDSSIEAFKCVDRLYDDESVRKNSIVIIESLLVPHDHLSTEYLVIHGNNRSIFITRKLKEVENTDDIKECFKRKIGTTEWQSYSLDWIDNL